MAFRRADWLSRWATDAPVQAGIAGASWSLAGSFARGLLPRAATQQAIASGVVAATHYQVTATTWATLQAFGAKPGDRPGTRANVIIAAAAVAGGLGLSLVGSKGADRSMLAACAATAGRMTAFAALAGGTASVWDHALHRKLGLKPGLDTTLLPAVATGAAVVGFSLLNRSRRASKFGIVAPERRAVAHVGPRAALKAAVVGVGSGVALAGATACEQALARSMERGISRLVGSDAGALGSVVAHTAILGSMALGAAAALNAVTRRVERRDDIVEPAYPAPPTSPHVSAGPNSSMRFAHLGKEGRRFVLMALTAEEISAVMGESAVPPVRVVGGYESASDITERARLTLQDMEDCGAFERSLICVGSPTGVGYFNYSIAEALEYLTRGDCAIVVPQYALVPSALALSHTPQAEQLTRLVLEGIRDRVAQMPAPARPRVILVGESLGANVALDLAVDPRRGTHVAHLNSLQVAGGLYLGVPFRSRLWNAWRTDPGAVDPAGQLLLVSQADHAEPTGHAGRHLMVIHHDDPVNKFSFRMIVQPPWWLGPPAQRPPLVPREVKFRPITSFVLATVDLFNGMQSKPGTFVRRGHDYRIEIRCALERAFGLPSTAPQAAAIEDALRRRESEWAARRMVARKLDKARRAIAEQFAQWGTPAIDVADLDPTRTSTDGILARLGVISGPPGI